MSTYTKCFYIGCLTRDKNNVYIKSFYWCDLPVVHMKMKHNIIIELPKVIIFSSRRSSLLLQFYYHTQTRYLEEVHLFTDNVQCSLTVARHYTSG